MPWWQAAGRDEAQTYRGWIEPSDDKENPVYCAVVMDASAWWQYGDHSEIDADVAAGAAQSHGVIDVLGPMVGEVVPGAKAGSVGCA